MKRISLTEATAIARNQFSAESRRHTIAQEVAARLSLTTYLDDDRYVILCIPPGEQSTDARLFGRVQVDRFTGQVVSVEIMPDFPLTAPFLD